MRTPDGITGRTVIRSCWPVAEFPGGRVFGASNRTASYPIRDDVAPWDIAATMYHLMGIVPGTHIHNRQGQPLPISRGQVISGLL